MGAVLKKAKTLGIQKRKSRSSPTLGSRKWTPAEDQALKEGGALPLAQLAAAFGRTKLAISVRLHVLGVSRDGKSRRCRPIGTERVMQGKLQRKVATTGVKSVDWKRVEVIEWEAKNGPIPEGMMLVKEPGKARIADNLRLVSPAEMPLTAIRHNMPPEMRRLLDLTAQIGAALGRIEKLNPNAAPEERISERYWSQEQESYLRNHYKSQSDLELAAALGRTELAVFTRRKMLKLHRKHLVFWNPAETALLVAIYRTASAEQLQTELNRSIKSIRHKASAMGLCR